MYKSNKPVCCFIYRCIYKVFNDLNAPYALRWNYIVAAATAFTGQSVKIKCMNLNQCNYITAPV